MKREERSSLLFFSSVTFVYLEILDIFFPLSSFSSLFIVSCLVSLSLALPELFFSLPPFLFLLLPITLSASLRTLLLPISFSHFPRSYILVILPFHPPSLSSLSLPPLPSV